MFNEPAVSTSELELESGALLPSRQTLMVLRMRHQCGFGGEPFGFEGGCGEPFGFEGGCGFEHEPFGFEGGCGEPFGFERGFGFGFGFERDCF